MEIEESNITKLCSFYVSEWHLVTMLLPYISKKINNGAKITTILEKNIEKEVITLVEKLNLKNKDEILKLKWNTKKEIKTILEDLKNKKELIIIVNGEKNFIKEQNKKIEKYIKENKINIKIKIINCYEITEYSGSVHKILDDNDKILNTSGEKEIKEIFSDYERKNYLEEDKQVG